MHLLHWDGWKACLPLCERKWVQTFLLRHSQLPQVTAFCSDNAWCCTCLPCCLDAWIHNQLPKPKMLSWYITSLHIPSKSKIEAIADCSARGDHILWLHPEKAPASSPPFCDLLVIFKVFGNTCLFDLLRVPASVRWSGPCIGYWKDVPLTSCHFITLLWQQPSLCLVVTRQKAYFFSWRALAPFNSSSSCPFNK